MVTAGCEVFRKLALCT
uniref:Uncharacterized protein n=1 Tax=Rhizophora mucronata TaxID=61149 RepID=A0A2P2QHN8_RHIMU